jgi:hypothetical protein
MPTTWSPSCRPGRGPASLDFLIRVTFSRFLLTGSVLHLPSAATASELLLFPHTVNHPPGSSICWDTCREIVWSVNDERRANGLSIVDFRVEEE